MTDTYQPVYDAVRSRIGHCDVGSIIEAAFNNAFGGASHQMTLAANSVAESAHELSIAAGEYKRPSAVFRPSLQIDGDQWCALYGADLQSGIAGFGDSPEQAMSAFDVAWSACLPKRTGAEG